MINNGYNSLWLCAKSKIDVYYSANFQQLIIHKIVPTSTKNLNNMNKIYQILVIGILVFSCKEKKTGDEKLKVEFNQELVDELSKMTVIDQLAASNAFPPKNYSYLTQKEWVSFKDSVFTTNQKRTGEIFNEYGFPGYDLAGKGGSFDFWLITQHSDHNPEFQQNVLKK